MFSEFRKRENKRSTAFPYRAARSFTKNPHLSFVWFRRSHELPDRFKNHLDLLIMGADPVF